MERTVLKIKVNDRLYLRDPQETELGRRIFSEGIRMIEHLGLERFTFKKLAEKIESTEASIYRYFENKNMFLLYLTSWYWVWMDFQVQFLTQNIDNPREKLLAVIKTLSTVKHEAASSEIDEQVLHNIILTESPKSYLLKEVDEYNQGGSYRDFKKFCSRIAVFINEVNPSYQYANSLASTLVEVAYQQQFFVKHLPSLSSLKSADSFEVQQFLEHLVFGLLEKK